MMKKTLILTAIAAIAVSCMKNNVECIQVVPYPEHIEMKAGSFQAAGADFHCSPQLDNACRNLAEDLYNSLSKASAAAGRFETGSGNRGFVFEMDSTLAAEAYTLDINRKSVIIKASGLNGFNYAIQTIRQMLPPEIYAKNLSEDARWTLPCASIQDEPRFSYRGMHLDVARHFYGVDEVKRYLDVMEIHKLNTLHWHLTDDQGWRIEIEKYPELTEKGSIRKATCIKGDRHNLDGHPYGGFYTKDEIREVISYAAGKGITVIPEIDFPGHMVAALTAYPELGCTGGPYDVWCVWGVSEDVICAGNDKAIHFLKNVLDEIVELFPSEYIHIGGDECPKVRWEKCPKCQAKIRELGLKDDEKHTAEHYLQSYIMKEIADHLEAKGRKVIGWDEILEGTCPENAVIMSWRGVEGGQTAAKAGHDVIMTPSPYLYFDYCQSLDSEKEPFAPGLIPVEKCYSFEPHTDSMTEEEKAHIIGVQANLWTEYIRTPEHLYYMLLPRMAALSEIQWCSKERKDYDRFTASVPHLTEIYDILGYNYAKHILQVRGDVLHEDGSLKVRLSVPGDQPIHYTLDGTMPGTDSPLYSVPVTILESCTLKACTADGSDDIPALEMSFTGHKALGKTFTVHNPARERYSSSLPENLTNGLRGTTVFSGPEWAGWHGTDFSASIDMKGETCSNVTIGTLSLKRDYIFNPTCLTVSVSEDGENYTEIARKDIPVETRKDSDGMKDYTVTFDERSVNFMRVEAGCVKSIPAWHPGKGAKGFLFIDEIMVR